ncbi:DUF2062 domain-containing protein [Rhodocyclaceae bacterium]
MRHWLRKYLPDHTAIHENRWLSPFRNSLLHPRLWHLNRRSAAGAVAVGLFTGLFPPPFQMVSAALCAVIFRINLPLAIFTTLYTNPLTFIPLYVFAFWLGSLILGGENAFIAPPEFSAAHLGDSLRALAGWLSQLGWPLAVGVLLLATVFAVLGYIAVRVGWRYWLVRTWQRRNKHR